MATRSPTSSRRRRAPSSALRTPAAIPKLPDTDGDRLRDDAEVNGTPATNPNLADTDGDTFSDRDELFFGSNPNSNSDTPLTLVIGDSRSEFPDPGQNGWTNGYGISPLTGEVMTTTRRPISSHTSVAA